MISLRKMCLEMMNNMERVILAMMALLLTINSFAQPNSVVLTHGAWEIPRHGEVMLKMGELSSIVLQWQSSPDRSIELRYPGGEEGELWVEELKDWLVSLGVPSGKILISPGSDGKDVINISLIEVVRNQ